MPRGGKKRKHSEGLSQYAKKHFLITFGVIMWTVRVHLSWTEM